MYAPSYHRGVTGNITNQVPYQVFKFQNIYPREIMQQSHIDTCFVQAFGRQVTLEQTNKCVMQLPCHYCPEEVSFLVGGRFRSQAEPYSGWDRTLWDVEHNSFSLFMQHASPCFRYTFCSGQIESPACRLVCHGRGPWP